MTGFCYHCFDLCNGTLTSRTLLRYACVNEVEFMSMNMFYDKFLLPLFLLVIHMFYDGFLLSLF